jgi:hypothetical protein
MDNRLIQDSQIEDALKTYPLVEMPQDITANVITRIQKNSRPQLITWSDFVLSFVIASCIAALFFTTQNLPPILLAKIKIQGILLYQDFLVNAHWLVPSLLLSTASILIVFVIGYLFKNIKTYV